MTGCHDSGAKIEDKSLKHALVNGSRYKHHFQRMQLLTLEVFRAILRVDVSVAVAQRYEVE